MKKKIFIGITTSKRQVSVNFSSKQNVTYIQDSFLNLIKSFDNVIPIILSPDTSSDHAKDVIDHLDGLILSSGEDIDPSLYNEANKIKYDDKLNGVGSLHHRPHTFAPNKERDLFEISLYHAAKEKAIPILGVCRGMQLINVAEGGSLFQEMPETHVQHFLEEDGWIHYHDVCIEKTSKFYDIMKMENYPVSSIHHQSIKDLGNDLKVVGTSDDGIIEIIEHNIHDFIMGFQGHIEKITENFPLYKKVIASFIENSFLGSFSYETQ